MTGPPLQSSCEVRRTFAWFAARDGTKPCAGFASSAVAPCTTRALLPAATTPATQSAATTVAATDLTFTLWTPFWWRETTPQAFDGGASPAEGQGLRRDGLHHLLRDVEVRVDLLDVVVLLEGVHQPQRLLGRPFVVQTHRRLGHHRQLGRVDVHARALDRLAHGGERLRRRGDAEARAVALDVVRSALGRGERDVVLAEAVGVHEDHPAPLEQPGDRARAAEVAVVLRERRADVGRGAVPVVGQRLDDHGDAVRAVALVDDLLERVRVGVGARASRDRA